MLLALHLLLIRHLLLLRLLQLLGASLRLRLLAESLLVAVCLLLTLRRRLRRRLGLALKLWRTLGERLLRLGHVRWPRLLT
ncbi:hypothetical protein [Corynebacterium sp. BF-R-2]|uniref:hypothetical protein n=1 Tax=Corynebacterium sp. BF-R-2 TaxID=2943494 RepID=UPI00211EC0C7|nr:hypothetical protein [Corynebacterium sp. BF-R-2]MCQ9676982.1 hypothetical protein [Corynebacterium sp. BF-R-2]